MAKQSWREELIEALREDGYHLPEHVDIEDDAQLLNHLHTAAGTKAAAMEVLAKAIEEDDEDIEADDPDSALRSVQMSLGYGVARRGRPRKRRETPAQTAQAVADFESMLPGRS